MRGKQRFFLCETCKNLVSLIEDQSVPLVCCGSKMAELVANTEDASREKHVPVVTVSGNEIHVAVGSVPHPMVEAHHISFVYLKTERGGQRKSLKVGEEPKVSFCFIDDKPLEVYEYCNLHGLWKTEVV